MRRRWTAWLPVVLLSACFGGTGGGERLGAERMITIHPRLYYSYILATAQAAVVDFEPIRESLCAPAQSVLLCQRAERVRGQLQTLQVQLTRLLGDAPGLDPVFEVPAGR